MEPLWLLLALLGPVKGSAFPVEHELAIVRTESNGAGKQARFSSHDLDTSFSVASAPTVSVSKLASIGSKQKLRYVFAAEFDGKPGDELVVVREKPVATKPSGATADAKIGQLDLDILSAPTELGAKKAKLVASFKKNAIGSTVGDGRVSALAAIDHDGDGRDGLAIVRTFNDGRQELTIHEVESTMGQSLGITVASVPEFGHVGAGEVLDFSRVKALTGADVLVIRRLDASGERVELRAPPLVIEAPSGNLFASYADLSASDGAWVERLTTMALPREGTPFIDYALVLQRRSEDGSRRIELAPLPLTMGATLPVLSALALDATAIAEGDTLVTAFGFRRGDE